MTQAHAFIGLQAAVRELCILLVDDEPSVARSLARALRVLRPQWQIDVAGGGAGALRHLAQSSYEVVVTDLEMPGVGGMALLEQVRRDYPGTVRLVHSSHIEAEEPMELRWLAHGSLRKPARPSDLIRLIENSLTAGSPATSS